MIKTREDCSYNLYNSTPLHIAATLPSRDLIEYFVTLRPDFTVYDCSGMTPLHLAAYHGYTDFLEIVAKKCTYVDFDFPSKDGKTIFDIAEERKSKLKKESYEFITNSLFNWKSKKRFYSIIKINKRVKAKIPIPLL